MIRAGGQKAELANPNQSGVFRYMGTFYVGCKLENHTDRTQSVTIARALVDRRSEYMWIPAKTLEKIGVDREKKDFVFTMANGQTGTRSVGFAIIRVEKSFTIDEVVFAEPGDLTLLGARTLEGLSLTVDARRKKLVASGPIPAASVTPFNSRYLSSHASMRI
jgi:predicted aspartyl protease